MNGGDIMLGSSLGYEATDARERVYLYLRQKITTGELVGGIRLVEEQIGQELGISRTPIREALQRLVSDGLVVRVRRGQMIVAAVDDETRAELHKIRIAFDQVAAELLTEKAGTVDWQSLYELLEPLRDAYHQHGVGSPQFAMAHLDLHNAINRAAFSAFTSRYIERQTFLYPSDDYVQQPGIDPIAQHHQLLQDLSSGDLTRAREAQRVHAIRATESAGPHDHTHPEGNHE